MLIEGAGGPGEVHAGFCTRIAEPVADRCGAHDLGDTAKPLAAQLESLRPGCPTRLIGAMPFTKIGMADRKSTMMVSVFAALVLQSR